MPRQQLTALVVVVVVVVVDYHVLAGLGAALDAASFFFQRAQVNRVIAIFVLG